MSNQEKSELTAEEYKEKFIEATKNCPEEDESYKEYESFDEWIVARYGGSLKNTFLFELVSEQGHECCCCCCCCDKSSETALSNLTFTAVTIIPAGCSSGNRKAVRLRWDADPSVKVDITVEEHRAGQGNERNAFGTGSPCNIFFASLQNQPPSRTAYWKPLIPGFPNPYRVTFRAYPDVNGVRQTPVTRTVIIN